MLAIHTLMCICLAHPTLSAFGDIHSVPLSKQFVTSWQSYPKFPLRALSHAHWPWPSETTSDSVTRLTSTVSHIHSLTGGSLAHSTAQSLTDNLSHIDNRGVPQTLTNTHRRSLSRPTSPDADTGRRSQSRRCPAAPASPRARPRPAAAPGAAPWGGRASGLTFCHCSQTGSGRRGSRFFLLARYMRHFR